MSGHQVQVSADRSTVWVHSRRDGSTVGRFSKSFGMDIHTTVGQQMQGQPQCLHCTHQAATERDWRKFIELMHQHHQIVVKPCLLSFERDVRVNVMEQKMPNTKSFEVTGDEMLEILAKSNGSLHRWDLGFFCVEPQPAGDPFGLAPKAPWIGTVMFQQMVIAGVLSKDGQMVRADSTADGATQRMRP